jgi:hypothetical protein
MPTPGRPGSGAAWSNDNGVGDPETLEKAAKVVPFVTTLPRVR